ncbi:virulence factor SrfB [Yersinia frederiksenii]|uniref:virulence factor SrfB n=1 Tax=Yersinia frederiksenii TaxID=29484 RepID=UPI0005DB0520|nr:virulence factor SrfB [Yersinia frederiksenii]CNL76174.1 putative virulence factor [Yersinia frederiksenii]CQH50408.1 putative virulence factor [Yersinia frederiksenii]HEC1650524.1 virulence factor SrfB [Yersinia enterocolitica]
MLIELVHYKPDVTLIQDSGIQFLDFGLSLAFGEKDKGYFVRQTANGPLLNLQQDAIDGKFTIPCPPEDTAEIVRPESAILLSHSLALLDGVWLPLPWLRRSQGIASGSGPDNWSRVQFMRLEKPDAAGNTVRMCIAFDTQIPTGDDAHSQLAPIQADIDNGVRFAFAWRNADIAAFLDNTWVDGWLREVFSTYAREHEQRSEQDIATALKAFEYQAHFLNLLNIMANHLALPEILLSRETLHTPAIPVDLVLDVGSTHTCGAVIEDHGLNNDGLKQCAELRLRSLSQPQLMSSSLFSSRLEFNEAHFGKPYFSLESGREAAFSWPSIVRLGDEAKKITLQRAGSEGGSGLSSPRRYLWDTTPVSEPWRFSGRQHEPLATALPLMHLVNDEGTPLYTLDQNERLPVFTPRYSRASLMTLILSELLAQTLVQINSPASRQQKGYRHAPRHLRHIILTLPSAMPSQERKRFHQHMNEAIALVWKSLNWHQHDEGFNTPLERAKSKVPVPTISLDWDEASCSQLVWLYNENRRCGGRIDKLFSLLRRPDRRHGKGEMDDRTLRVAAIDIGGGTTDLAITRYDIDTAVSSNVKITPQLLFREGFKNAGDDLLLEVIRQEILRAMEEAIRQAGVDDSEGLLRQLFGSSLSHDGRDVLRQQATLLLIMPLGYALLKAWEAGQTVDTTFGALLTQPPTPQVIAYIEDAVLQAGGACKVLDIPLRVDPQTLSNALLTGQFSLTQTLQSLCEVIEYYCCDVLLLSGRPSCLPGVQTYLRRRQPVPSSRIIWMQNDPLPDGFPFNQKIAASNPKTTAVAGAMLYRLAMDLRLPGFNFSVGNIQSTSTIRYLGVIDEHNLLAEENTYIQHNEGASQEMTLAIRGNTRLGFRQLANPSWPATPLYQLTLRDPQLARTLANGAILSVRLRREANSDELVLIDATLQDGSPVSCDCLRLSLHTLTDNHTAAREYWIDSGNLYQ